MAIISVTQLNDGWNGTTAQEIHTYQVETDDRDTLAQDVLRATGLPKETDTLSTTYSNYIIPRGGISAERQDNNPFFWNVTVTWQRNDLSSGGNDNDRLLSFSVQTRVYSKPASGAYEVEKPFGGVELSETGEIALVNSADDPFEPSTLVEEQYNTLLVWTQREERGFDYTTAVTYQGTINENKETILGIQILKGQGLLRKVNPQLRKDEEGNNEWITSYEVEITDLEKGFWLSILDAGFNAEFEVDGKFPKRRIKQSDLEDGTSLTNRADRDRPVSEPQLLDGDGGLELTGIDWYFKYRTKKFSNWKAGLNLLRNKVQ